MAYVHEDVPLTARALEEVTGITPAIRQDWTRRKLLPKRKTADQYSPREAAEILVVQTIRTALPIPLELALHQARRVAPAVLWHLITNFPSVCQFEGSPLERSEAQQYLSSEIAKEKSEFLFDLIGLLPNSVPHVYSVWTGGTIWHEFSRPEEFLNQLKTRPSTPLKLIIDHHDIANIMFTRLKQPMYLIRPTSKRRGKR